jgi:hypothetical protein
MGVWRTTLTNVFGTWTMIFRPEPTGTYRTTISGPFPLPDDTGTIHAQNSAWSVHKANGEIDGGTYQFPDANTVVFQGKGGILTWKRIEKGR